MSRPLMSSSAATAALVILSSLIDLLNTIYAIEYSREPRRGANSAGLAPSRSMSRIAVAEMSSAVNGTTAMPPAGERWIASGCCIRRAEYSRASGCGMRSAQCSTGKPGRCATTTCASLKISCQRCHVANSRNASAPSSSTSGRDRAGFRAQFGKRVDGVTGARAAHLALVDPEERVAGRRQPHHRQAMLRSPACGARDAAACRSGRDAPRRASAFRPAPAASRRWP